jgi:hypothetical protein
MRFVLGNRHVIAAGGTEVHLLVLGEHLQRLGHDVAVFAPELGPFADHLRRRGLEVHDTVRTLPEACDVVLAQDAIVAYDLVQRYPGALHAFRICGDVHDFQLPPQLVGAIDLMVVLSDRYARLAAAAAPEVPLLRLPVPIDIDRLVPLGPLRQTPRRAVLLGNYLERDAVVEAAWGEAGVEVVRVGGTVQSYDVAAVVADADIVVAKARAALDAMACGRAVYVFDVFGGDGWVTADSYPALEADNFAGQGTGRVLDVAELRADLAAYEPAMGPRNRDLVLQHHSARDHTVAFLAALAGRVPVTRPDAPLRELARLTALQWSWELTAREFRAMHWPLREHAAEAEQRAVAAAAAAEAAERAATAAAARERTSVAERDAASASVAALEAELVDARAQAAARAQELAALRATRAWRVAGALWRLRDRLRRRRS